uniref:Platelet endothelial aggregation receptor 1-like n=1 Tax=Crassostrea virginica TaxID=6565 RepID=A0A8B8AV27_CRAVI|nr:platelet endothelial aggregation receptor 1-like [Crassostrea virginica]
MFIATFQCDRHLEENCLVDCFWSKVENRCTDCALGYQGPKCTLPCRYPNYGIGCQQKCDCESKNCNPLSGCFESPECEAGFIGPHCSHPCIYPYHGKECKHKCYCDERICNHVTGCYFNEKKESGNYDQFFVIGISIGSGILIMVVIFVVIFLPKRRSSRREDGNHVEHSVA